MSVIVQGVLLGRLLKRFCPQRLARDGAGVVEPSCFALWGLATEGWMMYAVIVANVLGFAVSAAIQSIVSNAAEADDAGPHRSARSAR